MTERDQWYEIARGNVQSHLSDAIAEDGAELGEEALADLIYDEAFTLALDALLDAGVDRETAGAIATDVAQSYAQP